MCVDTHTYINVIRIKGKKTIKIRETVDEAASEKNNFLQNLHIGCYHFVTGLCR